MYLGAYVSVYMRNTNSVIELITQDLVTLLCFLTVLKLFSKVLILNR